jgi:hypothetical protein
MKSPFPGMDPYLERHWRDVHGTFIVHARAQLTTQLGGGLRARIEQRLIVESPWDEARSIHPDVRIVEHGLLDRGIAPTANAAAVAEPLLIPSPDELVAERYIEIIDPASGGKLITAIEFVSPTNKLPGDGREKYLQKQREVLNANVNLVEIDLTRSGHRELGYPLAELPPKYRTTYVTCAWRGFSTRRFEIYRMPLRERLPAIRIPLRDVDPDVVLDIQKLVDQAYDEAGFDDINYRQPCVPPLDEPDAAWADELLKTAGRR